MVLLTRIGVHRATAPHVLPTLVLMGTASAWSSPGDEHRDARRRPADAGVASATVNTMQQVGGSIGTALLSTIATSSLGRVPTATSVVHGYTLAFGVSAGIFAVGAIAAALLFESGAHRTATVPAGEIVAI